jgi:hypothetical protein
VLWASLNKEPPEGLYVIVVRDGRRTQLLHKGLVGKVLSEQFLFLGIGFIQRLLIDFFVGKAAACEEYHYKN